MSRKTQSRACPAAGREITPAECGAGRHTAYACPEQCPFNPFSAANYAEFDRIESATNKKLFDWILANVQDREQFERELQKVVGDGPNPRCFHLLARRSVFQSDSDGESCVGRWAKAGFPGLTGDECTFARGLARLRPALIEVHRVLDRRRVEVVDLLDPDKRPILVVDQAFALHATRFAVFSVYLIPLPNYCRIFGLVALVPEMEPLENEEIIRELVTHLGGPVDEAGTREFLKHNLERFEEALLAVASARAEAMLEGIDAQLGQRNYRLVQPYSQCLALLDSSPEVSPDPVQAEEQEEGYVEGRVWFAPPGDPETELAGQHALLGRVLLGPDEWRLQVLGAEKLDRLRQRFETLMGRAVRFTSQHQTDLAASLLEDRAPYDSTLVPPALLRDVSRLALTTSRIPAPDGPRVQEEIMADVHEQNDRRFLDAALDGLGGKSPRQAASDPAFRPKLVRMMKSRIRSADQDNLETGGNRDVNWMVRELGLDEILFYPPPPRPRPKRHGD